MENTESSSSGAENSGFHSNSQMRPTSVSPETLKFLEGIFHDSGFDFETRSEGSEDKSSVSFDGI